MPWFIYLTIGTLFLIVSGIIYCVSVPIAYICCKAKTKQSDEQQRAEWLKRLQNKEYEIPAELIVLRRRLAADFNKRLSTVQTCFNREAYLKDYKNLEAKILNLWTLQEEKEYGRDICLPDCRECSLPFFSRDKILKERMSFLNQINDLTTLLIKQDYTADRAVEIFESSSLEKEEINHLWDRYKRGKNLFYFARNPSKTLINYVSPNMLRHIAEA